MLTFRYGTPVAASEWPILLGSCSAFVKIFSITMPCRMSCAGTDRFYLPSFRRIAVCDPTPRLTVVVMHL